MIEDAEFEAIAQEDIQCDLRSLFEGAVKVALEAMLEEEVRKLVGGIKWARLGNRRDVRNGTYLRGLMTSMGHIDVAVPRTRESGSPSGVIRRYERRQGEVDDLITESYVNGVSTRKVADLTEALLGKRVSRSTVSRLNKSLDVEVGEFQRAPLEAPIQYLYLDATFIDARWARKVENVSALVAYGVDRNGDRRLLAITLGSEESAESWSELLRQLIDRGLHGVELVIADAHKGIETAVRHALPEAKQQRCVVHFQRNITANVPQRLKARLAREVWKIFTAPSVAEAAKRRDDFASRFGRELPEAVACLKAGFAAATQFFAFPSSHWKKIRSTNGLERFHREIKRRTDSVGPFPDRASALRLIVAVAIRASRPWKTRRYIGALALQQEKIQAVA